MGDTSDTVDRMDTPCRGARTGGCRGKEEASGGIEVDWDRRKVVKDAKHDGKPPESVRNECDVDTNALHRDRGPGGHLVEEVGPGDVEDDREHQSDGNGDDTDGI